MDDQYRNSQGVLKIETVDEIRSRARSGERLADLAAEFNISERTAKFIRQGRTWNRRSIAYQPLSLSERFEENVLIPVASGVECWIWQGGQHQQITDGNGHHMTAIRASYSIHVGDLNKDERLRRTCHNNKCVNPNHLQVLKHHETYLDQHKIWGDEDFYKLQEYHRAWRALNKRRYAEDALIIKLLLTALLGGKCEKCNCADVRMLQFHHKDRELKSFTIGAKRVGLSVLAKHWDMLKKEVQKCLLLCSNCHDLEHNAITEADIENAKIRLEREGYDQRFQ